MSLVAYSSSSGSSSADDDEDSSTDAPPPTKRLRLQPAAKRAPLPNLIKNLHFGAPDGPTEMRNVDEAAGDDHRHDGRIRTFAHERGNWATYAYIDFSTCQPAFDRLRQRIADRLPQLADFHATAHLHLSLTRTVVLQHHWIEPFVESLRERGPQNKRFPIHLTRSQVYRNDERTRTFIALACDDHGGQLPPALVCVRSLDAALAEFRLPAYYAEPSFHVSFLWCVGDRLAEVQRHLQALDTMLRELVHEQQGDDDATFALTARSIEAKIGNKLYAFPLV